MADDRSFEIETEIYHTQWENIRRHWDDSFKAVEYLTTLILLAVVPLKFLRLEANGAVQLGADPRVQSWAKAFVLAMIVLMGLLTLLNQLNHAGRSVAARQVVVEIERKWNLYDKNETFIFQKMPTKYKYAKFAGGERRLTHSQILFWYIILITVAAAGFVAFA